MRRGFFSGTIWGLVVGVAAVIGATQLTDRQDLGLPQPQETAAVVPDNTEFAEIREETDPVAPRPETDAAAQGRLSEAPAPAMPVPDVAPLRDADPNAVSVPLADAPGEPAAPALAQAPAAPSGRVDPGVASEPAGQVAFVPPQGDAPLSAGLDAPDPLPAPQPQVAEQAPVPEPQPRALATDLARPDIEESAPELAERPSPNPSPLPEAAPSALPPVAIAENEAPAPTPAPAPIGDDADQAAEQIASAMPGQRAGTLPGVGLQNSLLEAPSATPAALDTRVISGRALDDHRADFQGAGGLPLMSLILIVSGPNALPAGGLGNLPFEASFAVDAADPGSATTARALRAMGAEVLMIPSLPVGATPGDVEQALQANLSAIPEAIAFMDTPDTSFQGDRNAIAQIVAAAGATGHGLVTFPKGLNTAQQVAARDGVPAGLVFRDLDGSGQGARDIARSLDRAAFRARQEGQVILVARATGQTIEALTDWAASADAEAVTLAPVSALLAPQS